jgi:ATP synthase protein I
VPLINRRTGDTVRTLGALSAVGFAFVLAVVMGTALGYGFDRWLGTSPWLFLLGFFVGVAAGALSVYRTVSAVSRRQP